MRRFGFIVSIVTLFSAAVATAQTKVSGTVLDSLSREPETGAVIQFYKVGSGSPVAYSVSDSLGRFQRTFTDEGRYSLTLQNLGRKPVAREFTIAGEEILDLGEILVQDDAQAIEGASVQAMRTLVKLDVGKLTYKVEEDPDSKTGTVLDMLRKVPMVTVDGQDNITVNGSSSFKVYVDGKPNQMISANPSQILKVMPAGAIKDIEVITNPGAKYDAEGAGGVLNLITGAAAGASSALSDGLYGSVNLGYTSKGENASLFLSAKKNKLTVGVNASVGEQKLNGITFNSVQNNLNDGSALSTDLVQKQRTPFVYADLNASYEMSPRDLISGTFGMTGMGSRAGSSAVVSMTGLSEYSYSYDQSVNYKTSSVNGSLDYQHSFAEVAGRTLTLSYRYSGTPLNTDVINRFSSGKLPMTDRKSVGDDNSVENTLQLDFTTPIGTAHSLSSGLKFIDRHNSADDKLYLSDNGSWAYNKAGSMLYDHFNEIGAVYSEYTGMFGKFSVVAGVRYEYTWQRVEYGEGYGHDFKTGFGDLVPNLTLQMNLSATRNVGFTYNRRIQRPGITYLNPYVDRSMPMYITYGNSDLTSARSDILSLVYNMYSPKWIVSLTGRYNHMGSGISSYSFYDETGTLNTTYGNIVREDNIGLTAFINWTASSKTRIYTSGTAGYGMFSSEELGQDNHGWNWNALVGVQQTLPADILLSANIIANGRTWNLQGWSGGMNLAVLGVSKGFLDDKLKVNIQAVTNIGRGNLSMESFAKGSDYLTTSVVEVPIRQVGVGLTWTFGKQGFQVKKTRKSITNDDVINNSNGQGPAGAAAIGTQSGGVGQGAL